MKYYNTKKNYINNTKKQHKSFLNPQRVSRPFLYLKNYSCYFTVYSPVLTTFGEVHFFYNERI